VCVRERKSVCVYERERESYEAAEKEHEKDIFSEKSGGTVIVWPSFHLISGSFVTKHDVNMHPLMP